jgi:hypothetical protein
LVLLISSAGAAVLSRRAIFGVAMGAIALTLIASALKVYPFSSRLLIFLTPIGLLLIASAVDEPSRLAGAVAAVVVAVPLGALMLQTAAQIGVQPVSVSDMRGVVTKIRDRVRDGDAIAVTWKNTRLYRYYSPILGQDIPFLDITEDKFARSLTDACRKKRLSSCMACDD